MGKTMKYDLTVVLPSIKPHLVEQFYNSIFLSVAPFTFEMIVIGPYEPAPKLLNQPNVKFIKDLGNISRCVQRATTIAEGEYFTWGSDDGLYQENSLAKCLELFKQNKKNDGIIVRYYESPGRVPNIPHDSYWKAWTHPNQRLQGIPEDYPCCPVGMYNLEYFREIGGLDCRYHHVNMNAISLAYRVVNGGGKMHLSQDIVMICDFDNHINPQHQILEESFHNNDTPLFNETYQRPFDPNFVKINYNNWEEQPEIWKRFQ
jgi:hypothetical protein